MTDRKIVLVGMYDGNKLFKWYDYADRFLITFAEFIDDDINSVSDLQPAKEYTFYTRSDLTYYYKLVVDGSEDIVYYNTDEDESNEIRCDIWWPINTEVDVCEALYDLGIPKEHYILEEDIKDMKKYQSVRILLRDVAQWQLDNLCEYLEDFGVSVEITDIYEY